MDKNEPTLVYKAVIRINNSIYNDNNSIKRSPALQNKYIKLTDSKGKNLNLTDDNIKIMDRRSENKYGNKFMINNRRNQYPIKHKENRINAYNSIDNHNPSPKIYYQRVYKKIKITNM